SEKGNTQAQATAGNLKLQNIWFADMELLGADCNKATADALYDYSTKTYDESQVSFSHTFFLAQSGNKQCASADLGLTMPESKVGVNYMPAAGSALLSAAKFTDNLLANFDKVDYIGAFAAGDTWLDGWTEFDPQNAAY
ncbi:hypothetical protein NP234_24615, partial [Salmonella enterica]|nr:hypothetical protein [Salmonella enterica]